MRPLSAIAAMHIAQLYVADAPVVRRVPLSISDALSVESHRHSMTSMALAGLAVAVVLVLAAVTLIATTQSRVMSLRHVQVRPGLPAGSTVSSWSTLRHPPPLLAAWTTWAEVLCLRGIAVLRTELQMDPRQRHPRANAVPFSTFETASRRVCVHPGVQDSSHTQAPRLDYAVAVSGILPTCRHRSLCSTRT